MSINELWHSRDPMMWEQGLNRYQSFVKPENIELELSLDPINLQRLKNFTPQAWFEFLRDEYFRWKYTSANRYKTTTNLLRKYADKHELDELNELRLRLLNLEPNKIRKGLNLAKEIHGLGTAGASGLLSLMYPEHFATVD